ncbi:hypothetical protein [Nitrosospira lacus]|uniref:hypothetical protein n=1 Tax=Nitrosospira lacus TaxID=1288494 RepID=UPI00125EBC05|nr:hypothetical protein [Nitrosospira lacus]
MKSKLASTLLTLLALSLASTQSYAVCDFGPDTCLPGFVWREAFNGDHVCVTGATRTQAANDNSIGSQRKVPGTDACKPGFVWREASPTDHVCVLGSTRTQATLDNSQANARRDPQCANPLQNDTSPPSFIQNTITFVRVSDNLQVGSEIIPPAGLTKSSLARDRRLVIAASAGDNESGIANIRLQGGISWSCTARLENIGANRQGTLGAQSDEEKNNTSTPGNPLLRSVHFTIDPFEGNPSRLVCPCTNDSGSLTVTITLVARNGKGLEATSAPITVQYAPQLPTCGVASGEICGNKELGQVLTCTDGQSCDFKRSTVCSGWWIFRTCDNVQTTDMFCP